MKIFKSLIFHKNQLIFYYKILISSDKNSYIEGLRNNFMFITSKILINDSFNFFKNKLNDIFLLSLISAIVSLIFYHFLVPINEILRILKTFELKNTSISFLYWINELSDHDKIIMVRVMLLSFISVFIGLVLLISSLTTYLYEINNNNYLNAIDAIILSIRILPNMLFMLIICIIIIYFGLILLILPGIILIIAFSLSPIILVSKKNIMPLNAVLESWKISIQHWKLIFIMLLYWIITQMLFAITLSQLHFLPIFLQNIISFTLNNLLNSFMLIYFFRLYMLYKL